MISVLVQNINSESITVEGESFIHLRSSLRIKEGDAILAIDGNGQKRLTTVENIGKKSLSLVGGILEKCIRQTNIDILLSPPKRDALNDCLRMACELGVRNIYIFATEYTQNKKVDLDRMNKVLRAAVVQSNNAFIPQVIIIDSLNEITIDYKSVRVLHLSKDQDKSKAIEEDVLLAIGPEGGFSERDIRHFEDSFKDLELVTLRTPILRTPTALCAAFSWALSRI